MLWYKKKNFINIIAQILMRIFLQFLDTNPDITRLWSSPAITWFVYTGKTLSFQIFTDTVPSFRKLLIAAFNLEYFKLRSIAKNIFSRIWMFLNLIKTLSVNSWVSVRFPNYFVFILFIVYQNSIVKYVFSFHKVVNNHTAILIVITIIYRQWKF